MTAITIIVKATVVLLLMHLGVRLARHSRASVRHLLLTAGLGILAILPIAAAVAPSVTVEVTAVPVAVERYIDNSFFTRSVSVPGSARVGGTTSEVDRRWSLTAADLVAIGWAACAVLFLTPVIVGLFQVSRLRRSGVPWLEGQRLIESIGRDAGLQHRRIDVLRHEVVAAPATCGFRSHTILFPVEASGWSEQDVYRAAVHELEHVRRADCCITTVARVVCCFYWFHPLVWMAWRRLALEAERACDDAVLRGQEATAYADQLVSIAAHLTDETRHPLLAMANRSDLVQRISAVLDRQQARGGVGLMVGAVVGLAALVISVAIAPLQARDRVIPRPLTEAPNAQATNDERPVFEVASIKRGDPIVRRFFVGTMPGRFIAINATLKDMIGFAFDVRREQISGAATWIDSDRFTVEAKPQDEALTQGSPGMRQLRLMLRSLLEDRFRLQVHHDTRIDPMYELVVADGGPKLKNTAASGPGPRGIGTVGVGNATGTAADMAGVAGFLSGVLARRVIDKTGLTGTYDFTLTYAPAPGEPGPPGAPPIETPVADSNRASLFSALQEQLGLKLETTRGPVDVVVIDRAEKPIEN